MIKKKPRTELRKRRHRRNRLVVSGTSKRPRLSVFRSEKNIYAQLIDDQNSSTLTSASSLHKELKTPKSKKTHVTEAQPAKREKKKESKPESPTGQAEPLRDPRMETQEQSRPMQVAKAVGESVARKALKKGIMEVVFDRGGSRFHGRIKALADGAREAGLKF